MKLIQLSVHEFRAKNEGHYIGDNGSLGWNEAPWPYQCVNVNGEFLLGANIAQVYGNAIGLNYGSYGKFIDNLPTNFPKAGDFPVFRGGAYSDVTGHIGIALHNSDENRLHVLWQNLPDETPCQALYTSYDNCLGWWRINWAAHKAELTY